MCHPSSLIHLRRYQSPQSHQQSFGGRKWCFDDGPDLTQDFWLLPYQQCILVSKHNLENEIIQFFCRRRAKESNYVSLAWN